MAEKDYGDPILIQGGMGYRVSGWPLAKAVARAGEKLNKSVLGVVSGVGLTSALTNGLGKGDRNIKRALEAFPVTGIADVLMSKYWKIQEDSPKFIIPPKPEVLISGSQEEQNFMTKLLIAANFVEVWLAKEEHNGPIGINYLEKIQLSHLPETLGAMMAGVDYILMGAGFPNQMPAVLDNFAAGKPAFYNINVAGLENGYPLTLDPVSIIGERRLKRAKLLAIIAHPAAARSLNKSVDGFIYENYFAGGHNIPPRDMPTTDEAVYTDRDKQSPNVFLLQSNGKPVWLAGGQANPEKLKEAQDAKFAGVQLGSVFAASDESNIIDSIKRKLRTRGFEGALVVKPDVRVSPTGFPIQVVKLEDSLSDPDIYAARIRSCVYGILTKAYLTPTGQIGFRCPAEPIKAYINKGGKEEDTLRKVCLCAALGATVDSAPGPCIVTYGQIHDFFSGLMTTPDSTYSAEDVIRYMFS